MKCHCEFPGLKPPRAVPGASPRPYAARCESGVCRAPDSSVSETGSESISGPLAAELPTNSSTMSLGESLLARFDVAESLGPDLVAFVDESECYSGLRWVGEDAPSAHMAPGSDCVGCHAERGAVPLSIAGTNTRSGLLERPTMAMIPFYGGCARCHFVAAFDEPFPVPPSLEVIPADPEYVFPTFPVMIPGLGSGENPF